MYTTFRDHHSVSFKNYFWTEEHKGDAPRLASSAVTIPRGGDGMQGSPLTI